MGNIGDDPDEPDGKVNRIISLALYPPLEVKVQSLTLKSIDSYLCQFGLIVSRSDSFV